MLDTHRNPNLQEHPRRPAAPLLIIASTLAIALSACGGGGGSNTTAPSAPSGNAAVTVTVQPTTITAGQSATLTWSNTGSLGNCTASDGWTGSQSASGTQTVNPTATTTYTLNCSTSSDGVYGSAGTSFSGMATLTVNGAPAPTASAFTTKLLVSNTAIGTATVDPHLVNPWGIVFAPGDAVWTSNNGDANGSSTLYDGNGVIQGGPLVVTIGTAGNVPFHPTGIVFNGKATDFMVTPTGGLTPESAVFIYDGEDGMLAGWPATNSPIAVVEYVATDHAVYKGLAIANNGSGQFLYAADFHNNKIDVFDSHFQKQATSASSFAFIDPTLPAGYSAFGVQAIKGSDGATQIYVAYAPSGDGHDNGAARGWGSSICTTRTESS